MDKIFKFVYEIQNIRSAQCVYKNEGVRRTLPSNGPERNTEDVYVHHLEQIFLHHYQNIKNTIVNKEFLLITFFIPSLYWAVYTMYR